MGRFSLLLWTLLGLYLAVTVREVYQLFRPHLTPTRPGEHVFVASWGARHQGSPERAREQLYGWRLCVSSRSNDMSAIELGSQCLVAREDLQLNETLDVPLTAHIPSRLLRPLIDLQERYGALQDQLAEEEQQQRALTLSPGASPPSPSALLVGQLQQVRDQLQRSGLFLHSFIYRLEPGGGGGGGIDALESEVIGDATAAQTASARGDAFLQRLRADSWHVHSATRLLARWVVPRNHTRNLLSSSSSETVAPSVNATAVASPKSSASSSRLHVVHFLRPHFHYSFVSEDIAFPLSRVPDDLAHYFPKLRSSHTRAAYPPLIASKDLMLLRREWVPLNASFIEAVEREEENNGAPTLTHAEQEEQVFTTTSATQAGISDESASKEQIATDATTAPTSPAPAAYTSQGVTIHASISSTSLGLFRLQAQMAQSCRLLADMQDSLSIALPPPAFARRSKLALQAHELMSHKGLNQDPGKSMEELKSLFVDSSPWLLALTFSVSLVHLVLDLLAFRSDVTFWREQTKSNNFVGISARSIWISFVVRLFIFLYLVDQDASKIVLVSQGLSLAIQAWKSVRVLRVQVGVRRSLPFVFVRFGERPQQEVATQSHDSHAMKWLGLLSLPFVIGSALYSLCYHSHTSWYSWLLSSVATAMYTGGFVLMTPQLFINYKLKSVAHLPLRVFVYRACNTFIDDLFAFLIVQPTASRLACLRDDVIFFIYLYQRWIYPVDHSRTPALAADDHDVKLAPKLVREGEGTADAAAGDTQSQKAADDEAVGPRGGEAQHSAEDDTTDTATDAASTLTRRHAAGATHAQTSPDAVD